MVWDLKSILKMSAPTKSEWLEKALKAKAKPQEKNNGTTAAVGMLWGVKALR